MLFIVHFFSMLRLSKGNSKETDFTLRSLYALSTYFVSAINGNEDQ